MNYIFKILKGLLTVKNMVKIESIEVSQWLPISELETSWELFIIRNEKGWVRTCICLANRNGRLKLYDHNEMEIKGFNATYFMKINKPLNNRDYVIAMAKSLKITGDDLK